MSATHIGIASGASMPDSFAMLSHLEAWVPRRSITRSKSNIFTRLLSLFFWSCSHCCPGLADLVAYVARGIAHRLQFSKGDLAWHVFHPAIRRDHKSVRCN